MTSQCCKCNKVKVGGEWIHPTDAEPHLTVSHTYCPACHAETLRGFKIEWAAARRLQPTVA